MNNRIKKINYLVACAVGSVWLSGCSLSPNPEKHDDVHAVFTQEQTQAKQPQPALVIPDSVNADLMMSSVTEVDVSNLEERFNVAANNVRVKPFLQSLVEDTPYSVAFHPGAEATVSLDLKDVTINEVVEVLVSLYPLDIQLKGKVLQVFPAEVKTETIAINYLMLKRFGMTSTNINSGGIVQQNGQNGQSNRSGTQAGNNIANQSAGGIPALGGMMGMGQTNGSNIQTSSQTDFWQELEDTLRMIMRSTDEKDATVVVSPQSGLVTVRGLPSDIQAVKDFVKRSEENLLRQVILEAKIVEVALDDNYQQGINWQNVMADADNGATSFTLNTTAGSFGDQLSATLGGLTSLSFSNADFSGVVNLLKTQGNVQVLSSPRVTATNNQKAVIKVGEDEYFVTDVSNTTVTGNAISTTPEINLEPFFSGIALDVTPQISDEGEVILHVHPSVTEISEQQKVVTLNEEQYVLPLAQSNIRESDTVIRANSGEIVVIGGLMQSMSSDSESRVPFLGAIPVLGHLFKSKQDTQKKKELVILIKPTVVGTGTWREQMQRSSDLLKRWYGDK